MPDVYDSGGNRIGYIGSGGGGDAGGCLTLGIVAFVGINLFKLAAPVWAMLRAEGVHPVFIIALFVAVLGAVGFVLVWLLSFALVRAVAAGLAAAVCGYFLFINVRAMYDPIWAGGALFVYAIFAYRFVRWAHDPDRGFSDIFFL